MLNKKNISTENVSSLSCGYGYVVFDNVPESLVGRVLPIIEAMGLKDSQEKSVKELIRQTLYDVFYDKEPIYIDQKFHTVIRSKYWKLKTERSAVPMSA